MNEHGGEQREDEHREVETGCSGNCSSNTCGRSGGCCSPSSSSSWRQSIASLYLPTLNADIIDQGVATGNTDYILRIGGLMLLVTLLQIACTVAAVYFGAKAAMGLGRDLRGRHLRPGGGVLRAGSHPVRRRPASSPAPPTTSSRSSSWS